MTFSAAVDIRGEGAAPTMEDMQRKWDERYRGRAAGDTAPAAVLGAGLHYLHPPGLALDLACGLGANAIALSRLGFTVDAWDISPVAIHKLRDHAGLAVHAAVRDVIAAPPPPESYNVIIVVRFLERPLCPAIADALRPGGTLLYQTFTGSGPGPDNPAWRLRRGELPQLFRMLQPLHYREDDPPGEALLIARRQGACATA